MSSPDGVAGHDTLHAAVRHREVAGEGLLEHGDPRRLARRFAQRAHDLGAGGVARVQDARPAVRRFARQRQVVVGIAIEAHAERQQLAHGRRPFLREDRDRLGIGETAGHRHRVARVQLRRVVRPPRPRPCRPARTSWSRRRRTPPW